MRSKGPPIASGRRSVGGTCTRPSLRLTGADGTAGIVPVMSLRAADAAEGGVVGCGIGTEALSVLSGTDGLNDCRSIGVGAVIEGMDGSGATAGAAVRSAGDGAGAGDSFVLSTAGDC